MSKVINKYLCLVLPVMLLLSLTACQNEKKEELTEPTEEPVAEFCVEWSEKIPWADLDGDGTEEYILLEWGDFLNRNWIKRISAYRSTVKVGRTKLLLMPQSITNNLGRSLNMEIMPMKSLWRGSMKREMW